MHIAMIAAENAALRGGKVGGIGDVIRDAPQALARLGHRVSVITPCYGSLHRLNPATLVGTLETAFSGRPEKLDVYLAGAADRFRRSRKPGRVNNFLLEHPLFSACGAGAIYCNDAGGPFETDASKFALFCAAATRLLLSEYIEPVDTVHLHDWHASIFPVLCRFDPACAGLQQPLVFSIHNLSLQGIRPLRDHPSSLASWFPALQPDLELLRDPRYPDCINLMRAGIRLADRVHTVSPSYAGEILRASEPARGFIGGEGLENDLQITADAGKLFGILNGCEYGAATHTLDRSRLFALIEASLRQWSSNRDLIPAAHFFALSRLQQWRKRRRPVPVTITSVGRATGQKLSLLEQSVAAGEGGA